MEELTPSTTSETFIIYSTRISNPEQTPDSTPVPVVNKGRLELFPIFFPKDFTVLIVSMTIENIRRVTVTFFQDTPQIVTEIVVDVSSIAKPQNKITLCNYVNI